MSGGNGLAQAQVESRNLEAVKGARYLFGTTLEHEWTPIHEADGSKGRVA